MKAVRALNAGGLALGALVWLRAAVVGLPRFDALVHPRSLPHEIGHSWVAGVVFCLAPVLVIWGIRGRTRRGDLLRQFDKSLPAVAGRNLVFLLVFTAFLAPLLTNYSTSAAIHPSALAPGPARWFGSDETGADVFTRVVYGARVSLGVGAIAVGLGSVVGGAVGAVAGFYGGWVDRALMWATDLLLSLPRLAFLLLVIGLTRPDAGRFFVVAGILGLTGWMGVARIVRSVCLTVRELDYVTAARAIGVGEGTILLRHVVPNVAAPLVVFATLALGDTILAESSLAFLGRGASTDVSWGSLVAGTGVSRLRDAPWVGLFPGLAIVVTVVAFNLLGDGLRDALDPRERGRP